MKPSPFLEQLGLTAPPKPPEFKGFSVAKQFMLVGWGRYACRHLAQIEQEQEKIMKQREGGRWAILVADDDHALAYQLLEFRKKRVARAFGRDGLLSKAVYGPNGFEYVDVTEENKVAFQRYRDRAVKAAKRMAELAAQNPRDEEPEEYPIY